MEIYDIVKKLVGKIKPIGETTEDDRRFENLKVMTDLVDQLLSDIDDVALQRSYGEFSRQRAGKFAYSFLKQNGIVE